MSDSPKTAKPGARRRKAEPAPARSAAAISLGRAALRGKWATRKVDRNSLPVISGILGLLAMLLLIGSQWQVWQQSLSDRGPSPAEQAPQAETVAQLSTQPEGLTGDPTWEDTPDPPQDLFGETGYLRTAAKPPLSTNDVDYFTKDEEPVPEPIEPDGDWFDADESFTAAPATVDLKDEPMIDASEPFPVETMPPDDPFVLDIPPEDPPASDPFGSSRDESFPPAETEAEPFLFTPTAPPETPPQFAADPNPVDSGDPFGSVAPELELTVELPDSQFTARSGESVPLSPDLLEQLAQAAADGRDGWEMHQDRSVSRAPAPKPLPRETHLSAQQAPVRTVVTAENEEPAEDSPFSALPIQRDRDPLETLPAERSATLAAAPATPLPAPPSTSTVIPETVEQVPPRRIGMPAPQAAFPGVAVRVESPRTAGLGVPYRFHFEVINTGGTRLEGVVLRVDLPGSLHNSYGDRLHYRVGTLEPGARHRARLTVDPRKAGTVEVPVEVISRDNTRDALVRRVVVNPRPAPNSAARPVDSRVQPVRDALCLPLVTQPLVR